MRKLSILTVTTLFPNAQQPAHGAFVATRLRKLVETGRVNAEVIAPVPWLPARIKYQGMEKLRKIPITETGDGLIVHHPRYLVIPKIGMTVAPALLYLTLLRSFKQLIRQGKTFDVIDAHYFYPDGVAASWLGKRFGIPVTITARGTDINLIPKFNLPRRLIKRAAEDASGVITVCQALRRLLLVGLGVAAERINVLRNGVDLERFRPLNRAQAREKFGITRPAIASVGLLVERKGHHHVIESLKELDDVDLLIVGDGPDRTKLEALARELGVSERVRFIGPLPQDALPELYNAVDVLVLASSREGWANVLLEAMACGTPVVASAVWGTPEVVRDWRAGLLMNSLDARGVAEGVKRLLASYPSHDDTREYAEQFSWDDTTQGQLELFTALKEKRRDQKELNNSRPSYSN